MIELGAVLTVLGVILHGYAFILIFKNSFTITKEEQSKIIWIIVFGVIIQIIATIV